jgi:hypothetical protein
LLRESQQTGQQLSFGAYLIEADTDGDSSGSWISILNHGPAARIYFNRF